MDDVKNLFILRCFSNINWVLASDEVFININYPKEVIKIGVFMHTSSGKRILSLNSENKNIKKIELAFKKNIDREENEKEYKEIIKKLNNMNETQKLIIKEIFK